jgi:hypothetical protein
MWMNDVAAVRGVYMASVACLDYLAAAWQCHVQTAAFYAGVGTCNSCA